jgi:peptidoglycan/LPS O-acetylase OafA/YrhL
MKRIPQLDGVRGIAILLVIVWHCLSNEIDAAPKSLLYYGTALLRLTWSGVDLFFVLSGFLIAGILFDHRDTSNYFKVFYLRRACRILPLYFFIFALYVCLLRTGVSASPSFEWLFDKHLPGWSYATFTQNILMAARWNMGPRWLDVTWSLAVEEQFYLFVPLLIYFCPRRALLPVLFAAVLMAPILRWTAPGLRAFFDTPWRSDSILSGAMLAVLVRSHSFVSAVRRCRRLLFWSFVILLGGAGVMTSQPQFGEFGWGPGGTLSHLWLAGLYCLLVLIAFLDTEPRLTRLLRWPVFIWCGQLSYSIYLLHKPVLGMSHGLLRNSPPHLSTLYSLGITLLAFGITLGLAALSFRLFEGPIIRFGHQFPYSPNANVAQRAPNESDSLGHVRHIARGAT